MIPFTKHSQNGKIIDTEQTSGCQGVGDAENGQEGGGYGYNRAARGTLVREMPYLDCGGRYGNLPLMRLHRTKSIHTNTNCK